jgi:hypothetical protein
MGMVAFCEGAFLQGTESILAQMGSGGGFLVVQAEREQKPCRETSRRRQDFSHPCIALVHAGTQPMGSGRLPISSALPSGERRTRQRQAPSRGVANSRRRTSLHRERPMWHLQPECNNEWTVRVWSGNPLEWFLLRDGTSLGSVSGRDSQPVCQPQTH